MEEVSTNSLRALAPKWSLAGDDQLLNLLQSTHQKIITKCRDVNSKLEVMASSLDDASINLQNINNKFMALSNSQFIESRVYDDDADVTVDTQPAKASSQPAPVDELPSLRASLLMLERMYETAEIMDYSDSDSDAEISVVLKPKDMYSQRPLPYIIGSQHWKNKWHAGLIVEDSDTDSSTSKQDRDIEQYSDSEEEEEMSKPPLEDQTLSESSSSLPGSTGPPAQPPAGAPAARPADIAAALARRLAGDVATIVQEETEEYPPAAPAQRKVYKPEQPAPSAIFSDEPPPLPRSASPSSSDEDIFAEINKHAPYTQRNKVQSKLAEDLFSFERPPVEQGDIFSDFATTYVEKPIGEQKSTLFESESEPELFAEPPKQEIQTTVEKYEPSSKKPVGGISLFGSNKGAESIGAAILKRNQPKASTSDDESGSDDTRNKNANIKKQIPEKPKISPRNYENIPKNTSKATDETDNKSMAKKEKDIFDDLFSKSEKPVKNIVTSVKEKPTAVKEKEKSSVKDLFSDNIFDDIDDIFTSDVKIPTKESNQKSIFDDDDLFSDIDVVKTSNQKNNNKESVGKDNKADIKDVKTNFKETKSIFDSDDELFSDVKADTDKPMPKVIESHVSKDNITDNSKILDKNTNSEVVSKTETIKKPTETTKERNLFDDSPQVIKSVPKPQIKNKSIFDSDSDDDIFAKLKTPDSKKTNEAKNIVKSRKNDNKPDDKEDLLQAESYKNKNLLTTGNLESKEKSTVPSPSLFEEDEIDDLFMAANEKSKVNKGMKREVNIIPSVEKEPVIENVSKVDEMDIPTKIRNIEKEDDLPKSATGTKPNNVEKSEPDQTQDNESGRNDIFEDNLLQDDLFSKSEDVFKNNPSKKVAEVIESSEEVNILETKKSTNAEAITILESQVVDTKNISVEADVDNIQKPESENVTQSVFDDFLETVKEKDASSAELDIPASSAVSIFDNILTEPPAFKKPVEPKKSKNVNALFDDDSDDESLFFKKDDVIYDEKPDIFSKNANFDIFVDEPPAIDVDFTTKSVKNTDIEDDILSAVPKSDTLLQSSKTGNAKKDIFSPIPENTDSDNEEDLFSSVSKKRTVSKTMETGNNVDCTSVPETQENVPGDVNVIEENSIDSKPKITNIVSETKPQSKLLDNKDDKDLFSPAIDKNIDILKKPNILENVIDSDEDLFYSLPNLPKTSQKDQNNALKPGQKDVNKEKKDEFDDIFKSESPKKEAEIKKIGKLNTNNFNINVNALIPGASPKKVLKEQKEEQKSETAEPKMVKIIPDATGFEPKSTNNKDASEITSSSLKTVQPVPDETDFKPKPASNKTENEIAGQREPKTDKPVTFDEKSESEVLDNNLSKQRPRIQIKRRPSSRKARHEAVRKSGIDFGDDTDNSSSFDEPKPRNIVTKQDILSKDDTSKDTSLSEETKKDITEDNSNKDSQSIKSLPKDNDIVDINESAKEQDHKTQKEVPEEIGIFGSMSTNLQPNNSAEKSSYSNEIKNTNQDLTQNLNENKQTTTKIVYILNDEDIFNTQTKKTEKPKDIFGSPDSESDIFKSTEGIKTLGNTYKEDTKKNNKEELRPNSNKEIRSQDITTKDIKPSNAKTSLFDDSDEELFNKKKQIVKKSTIFDSDSEEDLFSGKKSSEKKNKEVRNKEVKERKEVVVKGSLFGDDDDDDDLFGVKKHKAEPKRQPTIPSTSKEVTLPATATKSAEPVFDDPLSMLGNDD